MSTSVQKLEKTAGAGRRRKSVQAVGGEVQQQVASLLPMLVPDVQPGVGPGVRVHGERGSSVAVVINDLHDGRMRPEELTAEMRLDCISQLTLDGFTSSEIAHLMRINERTVRRDRASIRKEQGMTPSLTLGDEMLGEFERLTYASIQRLTRIARDPSVPANDRLAAEKSITRTYQQLIQTVSKMQYVETGGSRLCHQRETDPQEIEQTQQRILAMRRLSSDMIARESAELFATATATAKQRKRDKKLRKLLKSEDSDE